MTEEVAKIKANKDGTYIDIVPEKCVSAQKAQYDENGRDLLDAESSQTIKGANTFAAKQTLTGGVAVSGTSAISGNVNLDSGAVAIGSAVTVENHGKITADNTSNSLKVADHDSVLTGNDVLNANDIMTANGDANNLVHRLGSEVINGDKTLTGALTILGSINNKFISTVNDTDNIWTAVAKWEKPNGSNKCVMIVIGSAKPAMSQAMGVVMIGGNFDSKRPVCIGQHTGLTGSVAVGVDADGYAYLLIKKGNNNGLVMSMLINSNWGSISSDFNLLATHVQYSDLSSFVASAVLE